MNKKVISFLLAVIIAISPAIPVQACTPLEANPTAESPQELCGRIDSTSWGEGPYQKFDFIPPDDDDYKDDYHGDDADGDACIKLRNHVYVYKEGNSNVPETEVVDVVQLSGLIAEKEHEPAVIWVPVLSADLCEDSGLFSDYLINVFNVTYTSDVRFIAMQNIYSTAFPKTAASYLKAVLNLNSERADVNKKRALLEAMGFTVDRLNLLFANETASAVLNGIILPDGYTGDKKQWAIDVLTGNATDVYLNAEANNTEAAISRINSYIASISENDESYMDEYQKCTALGLAFYLKPNKGLGAATNAAIMSECADNDVDEFKKVEEFKEVVRDSDYLEAWQKLNALAACGSTSLDNYIVDIEQANTVDHYVEDMNDALTGLAEYSTADVTSWGDRAKTWQYRVKYLTAAAYGLRNGVELDSSVTKYYNDIPDFIPYPDLTPVCSKEEYGTNSYDVTHAKAYYYLYWTIMELPSIVARTAMVEGNKITDSSTSNLAALKAYTEPIASIMSGVEYYKTVCNADGVNWLMNWIPLEDNSYATVQQLYNYFEQHSLLSMVGDTVEIQQGSVASGFFSTSERLISESIVQGVAYSSLYTPMVTNVYDAYVLAQQDSEFLKNFHYKYGFQRKALYRDTNVDAAVEMHNTGAKGKRKVCTLRDFLEQEGDTVLYIDDNFYNAKDLAEKLDMAFNRLDGAEGGEDPRPWYKRLWSSITDWFTVDIYEMTKTAEETEYSHKLYKRLDVPGDDSYKVDATAREAIPDEDVDEEAAEERDDEAVSEESEYVMTSDLINYYKEVSYQTHDENNAEVTRYQNYSPLFSYAFVSGIYREEALFNLANSESLQKPVYVSSADLACMKNATAYEKGSLLNYAMQRNLEANMPIGYSYNIDMDSPIYMDIYGNILTESGVVVIPAASNLTLYNGNYHKNLFSMGLFLVYGKDWSIPCDWSNIEEFMVESGFEKGENDRNWRVASRTIGDNDVDYARLVTGDTSVNDEVYQYVVAILHQETYDYFAFVNIILEVLRGAPIDNIDKDAEGINPDHRLSKSGLIAAAKFEELDDALTNVNGNAMMSVPNLAFVSGFEYIALFAFKIIVVVCVVIMLINIFIDVLRSSLSLSTFGHCLGIVAVTVLSIMTIPLVFQVTYYEANRVLLQNETTRIALLNEEKRQQGVEIGVYTVKEPKEETELLIKLEDLDIPWWDLFYRVTTQDVIDQMEELMQDYTQEALTRDMPGVTVMNNGVYMTVNDLFDSATIEIDLASKQLYMLSDKFCTASFFSPYYVFLDVLAKRVNTYNLQNNWYSYTMKTQRGGRLKTVGLAQAYFTSNDFMETKDDIFWITEMHGKTPSLIREEGDLFTSEAAMQMGKSMWASQVGMSDKEVEKRAKLITKEAQKFVANYKDLLGKISDETFLKVMALDLAMYHNDIFGVDAANCYEVYKLSQNDLTRLSIANDYLVMTNSTLNYSRFLYEVGGTTAIYAGAFKSLVEWLGSYLKPLATLAIFIIIFVSMFIFKCVWRKEDTNYNGYIITTLLLCLVNVAHALLLKLSMYLPSLNLSATVCLLFEAVIELLYLAILGWVLYVSLKDWRNLGMERYMLSMSKFMDKFHRKRGFRSRQPFRDRLPKNNWDYYHKLVDQRKERE